MEASSLVLMEKENGILTNELGSYTIERGLDYVYSAYVENERIHLFITIDEDLSDEEYDEVFDSYNIDFLLDKGYEVEEVEEYNPIWHIEFNYAEEYTPVANSLNEILSFHVDEAKRILGEIKK